MHHFICCRSSKRFFRLRCLPFELSCAEKDRELQVNLILLNFGVILRMDWLSQHFAIVDCRRKEVIFRILNDEEFKFVGDKSSAPQNLISAITAKKMLRKGCQGYYS